MKKAEDYALLDSGEGQKLERFGKFVLVRPCSQAIWSQRLPRASWKDADAFFSRDFGNRWEEKKPLPESWEIELQGIRFKLKPTDFGHLGIFPEQAFLWEWIREQLRGKKTHVLNLFAYSGGATLAAAQAGAKVCHLDASKGMVTWARENALLNGLSEAPIRWIVDDATKFLTRELRRGVRYDAIICDPPTFGRGSTGEIFKLERDIHGLLEKCIQLLSPHPLFFLLTSHTSGVTATVLRHVLEQSFPGKKIRAGEMLIPGNLPLPSGSYAHWSHD